MYEISYKPLFLNLFHTDFSKVLQGGCLAIFHRCHTGHRLEMSMKSAYIGKTRLIGYGLQGVIRMSNQHLNGMFYPQVGQILGKGQLSIFLHQPTEGILIDGKTVQDILPSKIGIQVELFFLYRLIDAFEQPPFGMAGIRINTKTFCISILRMEGGG